MTTGVILLNFGEPAEPTRDAVVPYLERIFYQNRFLEDDLPDTAARERSQELAERRAPGLMAEYEVIGGRRSTSSRPRRSRPWRPVPGARARHDGDTRRS